MNPLGPSAGAVTEEVTPPRAVVDPADPNQVQGDLAGFELLRPFNAAGVLAAADVHTAVRLSRLAGSSDDLLALAMALAVRAPRVGHVAVDLADIGVSAVDAADGADLEALPWPEPSEWLARVADSDLVALDPPGPDSGRPLVLAGWTLYLERYWRDEVSVAGDILARLGDSPAPGVAPAGLPAGLPVSAGPPVFADPPVSAGLSAPAGAPDPSAPAGAPGPDVESRLGRLFPGDESGEQLDAARLALSGRFTVIAGGPGTGKTTTVARLLAVVFEAAEAAGTRLPLVGLAAPTGKAAARMEEAVRAEATRMDTTPRVRAALTEVRGSTLHRLLGTRFDRPGRFRHHRGHRLPHDVVIVDEASMVSLSLMAGLAEAVGPEARLILVGDPEQLVSVEAGAVLADIVGPAGTLVATGPEPTGPAAATARAGARPPGAAPPARGAAVGVAASICVLRRNHRFGGALARLSEAVRVGDGERVLAVLSGGEEGVAWIEADPADLFHGRAPAGSPLHGVRASTQSWAEEVGRLAVAGDAAGALAALRANRVLCAHRRGVAGVSEWNRLIEGWLGGDPTPGADDDTWYPGRPVLVTANDYALRLFNGDTGVAVNLSGGSEGGARLVVAFDEGRDRTPRNVSPTRLTAAETVYAMTVHKSQGSEFDRITLLLPPAGSRLLSRQLVYTAVTRARQAVTVVGTTEALVTAVQTPVARASGLGDRLWGPSRTPGVAGPPTG